MNSISDGVISTLFSHRIYYCNNCCVSYITFTLVGAWKFTLFFSLSLCCNTLKRDSFGHTEAGSQQLTVAIHFKYLLETSLDI